MGGAIGPQRDLVAQRVGRRIMSLTAENRRRQLLVFGGGCGSRCSELYEQEQLIDALEWIATLFHDSFRARGPGTGDVGAALSSPCRISPWARGYCAIFNRA